VKVIYTDVLVIGGGLAGLRLAIAARRRGHDAIIVSLVPPKRSHSKAAQGGMQASLGNVIKGQGDNEDVHFEDTVRGSDWGADQEVVRMFVNTAPKAVRELAAWGVPWSRVRQGDRQVVINSQQVTITERAEAHGLVAQRDFGGTKKWRTCYVADGTGHAMLQAVGDRAIAESIPVHERAEALALIHDGGRCYGAVVRDLITGALSAYVAKATAITTGGAGRLYRVTTNAVICEGIGHAIALETGAAALGNMEAVQFHPTGIVPCRDSRHRGLPRRRGPAEGRRRAPLHAGLRAGEEGARVARRRVAADGGAHREGQGRAQPLRRPHLARHHAAGRAPHQAQPARGLRDLPLLPRRRSYEGHDPGAPGAALHDGRRAHRPHGPEPDA
jgi:fumarate reductase flavoprotein subunit